MRRVGRRGRKGKGNKRKGRVRMGMRLGWWWGMRSLRNLWSWMLMRMRFNTSRPRMIYNRRINRLSNRMKTSQNNLTLK